MYPGHSPESLLTTGGGFSCHILEYFPGGTLFDLVESQGCMGEETVARRYLPQIVSGLS